MPRSIPAHAGEPRRKPKMKWIDTVYPRPRGGTSAYSTEIVPSSGLSPPTRGNPALSPTPIQLCRSIPAHAGEPRNPSESSARCPVYPRPRGGTREGYDYLVESHGLSPPTRGNPPAPITLYQHMRSIPAHAGEPRDNGGCRRLHKVYPRPRGGTGVASVPVE